MRFHLGSLSAPPHPDAGSRAPNDASWLYMQAAWLGAAILLPLAFFAWTLGHPTTRVLGFLQWGPFTLLGLMVLTFALHELAHLLTLPNFGMDESTVVGFEPRTGFPYVTYLAPVRLSRFVAVAVAPLLGLSAVPLLAATVWQGYTDVAAFVSLLNAAGSGGDVLLMFRVLRTAMRQSDRPRWVDLRLYAPLADQAAARGTRAQGYRSIVAFVGLLALALVFGHVCARLTG